MTDTKEWVIIGFQFIILGFVFNVWLEINDIMGFYGQLVTDIMFGLGILMFLVPVGLFVYARFFVSRPRHRY